MGLIHLLDETTINQIAAGEVIESPAAVLKELVENAVDSGAHAIRIEAKSGGFQLLRISDDGVGMDEEDLKLCLLRHATSKMRFTQELQKIQTLGFRGEALASIAAISHIQITSACKQSREAYELSVNEEGIQELRPAARANGTTVEVRDLFYNVPARKAFQKSAPAASSELTRLVGHLALAYPYIGFTYIYNDKEQLHTYPDLESATSWSVTRLESICHLIMGEKFTQQAYPINQARQGWHLRGFLGHPLEHRANRLGQLWVVNGRLITSAQLSRGAQEGYGTRQPPGRFAQFVLHVDLPGEWVDVNVHPQKRELRFRDLGLLTGWVAHVVNLALTRSTDKSLEVDSFLPPQASLVSAASAEPLTYNVPEKLPWDPSSQEKLPASLSIENQDSKLFSPQAASFKNSRLPSSNQSLSLDIYLNPLAVWKQWSLWKVEDLEKYLPGFEHAMRPRYGLSVLAWMSHPRALARIRFEQAMSLQPQVTSQALLLPLTIAMNLGQLEKLKPLWESLHECGFELTQSDRLTLTVHSIPSGLDLDHVAEFLQEMVESSSFIDPRQMIALGMAKQIEHYTAQVGQVPNELILGLASCKEKFFSPTARAIFRPLSQEDLEIKGRFTGGLNELA